MQNINKKDVRLLKITGVALIAIWLSILTYGIWDVNRQVNSQNAGSGEANVLLINEINKLNQRVDSLEEELKSTIEEN